MIFNDDERVFLVSKGFLAFCTNYTTVKIIPSAELLKVCPLEFLLR